MNKLNPMKMPGVSLLDWQKKYGTEKAYTKALYKVRWPEGFYCPRCGCNQSSYITTREPELPFRLLNACLTHVPVNRLKIV